MASKGVELASAYVSLSISTRDLPGQVEDELKKATKGAEKAGKDIGKKMSDGVNSSFTGGNMSKALARELGSAGDKGSKELLRSLASGHRQAEKDASTAGRRYATAMAAAMAGGSKDTARRFEAEFRNALNARNSSQAFFDEFHRDGVARGQKIGTAIGNVVGKSIGTALKVGVAGAAGAAALAVGGVGTVLYKGFQRLKNIDNAKFKLQALGNSASDVKQIMADAEKAVKGTAFSLDEAATGAASAVAAGIKPGEELTKYLTTISDTAAIAGTSFEEMASIFNKVTSNNKAYTDDLQMLADRGVPIFQYLRQQFGVTAEEFQKMVEDGKVSAVDFEKALDTHLSGAAQKMGQSLSGSLKNLEASMSRIGALALAPAFGETADGITGITDALKGLEEWMGANQDKIYGFWTGLGTFAIEAVGGTVSALGLFAKAFAMTVNAMGDTLGGMTRAVANVNDWLGRDDIAEQLRKDAEGMFGWGDGLYEISDGASELALKFVDLKDSITDWGERGANAAKFTRDLGDAVKKAVADSDGGVILKAPTADDLNQIDEAKYRIEQIPGTKDFKLIPRTEEATAALEAWREKEAAKPVAIGTKLGQNLAEQEVGAWRTDEEGNPVRVPVDADTAPADEKMRLFIDQWSKAIITPQIALGSGVPGQNPLDIFAPGAGGIGPAASGPANAPQIAPGVNLPGVGTAPRGNAYGATSGGQSLFGPGAQAASAQIGGLSFAQIDQIAASFGLKPASTHRPGDDGYHGSNQATDYGGSVEDMQAFAAYMSQNYGGILKELIFDAKGWAGNVKNGAITGPFGNVYTMAQAGYHGDHVHIAIDRARGYQSGGAATGSGTSRSDSIPAWLSNGEHVLTANDVAAMGGQAGVYSFRNALHRQGGGSITWLDFIRQGASGGGGGYEKGPARGDIGQRIQDKIKPRKDDLYGDPKHGLWPGEIWGPRGSWTDLGVIADWWMWPGEPQDRWGGIFGMDPRSKDWERRRDIIGAPTPDDKLPPGAWNPKTRIPFKRPNPEPGAMWPVSPPQREMKWGWGFADGGAVDPNLLLQMLVGGSQHGQAQGMPIGPMQDPMQQQDNQIPNINTEGYIPAGAGYSGATTGGLYGGFLNMGAEAINGIIDKAAQAGGMAADAFAPGSSQAVQIGADIAKRGVSYGFQMAGIGAGALAEILSPFGVSRWFSDIDPTAFIPQQRPSLGAGPSATGQMVNDPQHPGQQMPWTQEGMDASIDWFHREAGVPNTQPGTEPVEPTGTPQSAQPAAAPNMNDPMSFLKMFGIFDHGGILRPNSAAINLSRSPEYVFNQSQWKTMEANASGGYTGSRRGGPLVQIDKVEGMNPDDVAREIGTRTRRAARQYSVRP